MAAKLSGAKGGRYQLLQNADMNVTPFVDVMLVLLIIFMVAAPLATLAVKVDLPTNHTSPIVAKPPAVVSIARDAYYVAGRRSSLATLVADLGGSPAQAAPVMIRAGRDVDYSRFMGVVNELKAHGIQNVSLIAEDAQPV